MTIDDVLKEFDEMESNHGWIPEHKERIKDFIRQVYSQAEARGREEVIKGIELAMDGKDCGFCGYGDTLSNLLTKIKDSNLDKKGDK